LNTAIDVLPPDFLVLRARKIAYRM